MSMLHAIVSTSFLTRHDLQRRRLSAWPSGTTTSTRDILIQGKSLTDLAYTRGTPCVLIARSEGSDRSDDHRTVVLATILGRAEGRHLRPDEITVDCDLRSIRPQCLDALLVNSPRALARTPMLIHSRDHHCPPLKVSLPSDTSQGDLLALVCRGTIAASQARLHDRHTDAEDDDWQGRCMK